MAPPLNCQLTCFKLWKNKQRHLIKRFYHTRIVPGPILIITWDISKPNSTSRGSISPLPIKLLIFTCNKPPNTSARLRDPLITLTLWPNVFGFTVWKLARCKDMKATAKSASGVSRHVQCVSQTSRVVDSFQPISQKQVTHDACGPPHAVIRF